MKYTLRNAGVTLALLAGATAWSGAQATVVNSSHVPKALVFTNAGTTFSTNSFGRTAPAGSVFSDQFTFTLNSPTRWSEFLNFQVSSDSLSAVTGLNVTGFTLTGPTGLIENGSVIKSGSTDLLTLGTTWLRNGAYTLNVSGTVLTSGASIAVSGKVISAVPEPETLGMFAGGLGLIGFIARRKKRRSGESA